MTSIILSDDRPFQETLADDIKHHEKILADMEADVERKKKTISGLKSIFKDVVDSGEQSK